MKIFELIGRAGSSGEYLLGSQETGSHACFLSIVYVVSGGHSGHAH